MATPCHHDDIPAADIGNITLGTDAFAMTFDEVLDQSFADRFVADRQLVPTGLLHQIAKDHGRWK